MPNAPRRFLRLNSGLSAIELYVQLRRSPTCCRISVTLIDIAPSLMMQHFHQGSYAGRWVALQFVMLNASFLMPTTTEKHNLRVKATCPTTNKSQQYQFGTVNANCLATFSTCKSQVKTRETLETDPKTRFYIKQFGKTS